jgi:hypothetical protein
MSHDSRYDSFPRELASGDFELFEAIWLARGGAVRGSLRDDGTLSALRLGSAEEGLVEVVIAADLPSYLAYGRTG